MSAWTEQVEFDATIDEKDVTISFLRTIETHRENYGADADGNRGMMTSMIDVDAATDVKADFGLGAVPLVMLSAQDQSAVLEEIDKYLETTAPEGPDDGPDERDDYDDQ